MRNFLSRMFSRPLENIDYKERYEAMRIKIREEEEDEMGKIKKSDLMMVLIAETKQKIQVVLDAKSKKVEDMVHEIEKLREEFVKLADNKADSIVKKFAKILEEEEKYKPAKGQEENMDMYGFLAVHPFYMMPIGFRSLHRQAKASGQLQYGRFSFQIHVPELNEISGLAEDDFLFWANKDLYDRYHKLRNEIKVAEDSREKLRKKYHEIHENSDYIRAYVIRKELSDSNAGREALKKIENISEFYKQIGLDEKLLEDK